MMSRRKGVLQMRFVGLSDVGRKRAENEDRFSLSEAEGWAVLCDGMGGRAYGEVASAASVQRLAELIHECVPRRMERLDRDEQAAAMVNHMDEWVRQVNEHVYGMGLVDERYREMGTTLVCLLEMSHQVVVGHVGDSRAYRLHGGRLEQITEDHSVVAGRVKEQQITAAEAKVSRERNIITQAIGTALAVRPDVRVHTAMPGDRFLLCSDGLHDMLSAEELERLVVQGGDLNALVRRLVDAANAAGGRDNITVIVGEVA